MKAGSTSGLPTQAHTHHPNNASNLCGQPRCACLSCSVCSGPGGSPLCSWASGKSQPVPAGLVFPLGPSSPRWRAGYLRTCGAQLGGGDGRRCCAKRAARGSLTMLTSETTSMLAISIRMPTSTGGPAGGAAGGVSRRGAPGGLGRGLGEHGRLTSEIGPEADVVALEQPVHRLLHVGHVAGPVGAAGCSTG